MAKIAGTRGPTIGRKARTALYFSLRMQGKTKLQAAMALDISLATAITYEREWQELVEKQKSEEQSKAARGLISRDELAVRLSQAIASEGTPVQYLSALSRALAELKGYNAPRQLDVHDSRPVKPISELLDQWNKERKGKAGGAPPSKLSILSSAESRAATDLEKGSSHPVENKATSSLSGATRKPDDGASPNIIIINDLQNRKSDA